MSLIYTDMTSDKKKTNSLKKYLVLKNSISDSRVNSILDKILVGGKLTKEENNFLDKFDFMINFDLKDYSYISKNIAVEIIESLLKKNIEIICDLEDRDGKFGDGIVKIKNNFEGNRCEIYLKKGEKCYLEDKFLYNLFYNINKNNYSLTIQDEYFEKITIDKNED